MTTVFQNKLIKDKDTLWEIVKVFHPDIPDTITNAKGKVIDVKEEKLSAYRKYDWVCIRFTVSKYGEIDIGITNCYQHKLFGEGVTRDMMKKALSDGTCKFKVWRFVLDSKYHQNKYDGTPHPDTTLEETAIGILQKNNYQLQSVNEMYEIYYED